MLLSTNVHMEAGRRNKSRLYQHVLNWIRWLQRTIVLQCSTVPLWRGLSSHKYSQKTPRSSPVRARYGVALVAPASDWYSAALLVIIYVISYNIGPRDNGTRLYISLMVSRRYLITFGNSSLHCSWSTKSLQSYLALKYCSDNGN